MATNRCAHSGSILRRGFYKALTLFMALCPFAMASDKTVTAVGTVSCYDGSHDLTSPLAGARIELWNSNCDGSTLCDDRMGQAHINDDGTFSVTGKGGDLFSGPDVYVRIVYNDDAGVRLTDELNGDRWVDTPEHDHNDVGDGTIDFGSIVIGLDVGVGNASKCGVWDASRKAFKDFVSTTGSQPPSGHYDIEYWTGVYAGTPWTNTDTTHWPIHFGTWAQPHEFGHTIRHSADGSASHFAWDATRFLYARTHHLCDVNLNHVGAPNRAADLAFGFNEGWAEFWAGETSGCGSIVTDPAAEGNVAFALNALSKMPGMTKTKMVDVLRAHPQSIHSLDEFIDFLALSVGSSSSPLIAAIDAAPKSAQAQANQKAIAFADQMKHVRAWVEQAEGVLARKQKNLTEEIAAARRIRTCIQVECDLAAATVASVPLMQADIAINRLALERLKQSTTDTYQQQTQKQRLEGTYDRINASTQAANRKKLVDLQVAGVKRAAAQVANLADRSPDARPLVAKWRERLATLLRELDSNGHLPPGISPNLMVPEDAVRITAR